LNIQISSLGKKLVFWGAVLFLLGLLQGALIPYFLNPRMALSAHLAAVQSGMALMIFGLIWGALALEEKWFKVAYYSSIASMFLVWFAISLSAVFGASRALPMAGKGFSSTLLIETVVELVVYIGAGSGVISITVIVFGLYKGLDRPNA
jgi:hydroxylaminobenzene mutase